MYSVSFNVFNTPASSFAELGKGLASGLETIRKIQKKVHLGFLHPETFVHEEFILYPPDSFWLDRKQRSDKIAGRYTAGFNAKSSEYPNKSIAYVLIGMPSPALSLAIIDEKLKGDYVATAQRFPFYVPAYSYEGKLLYAPQEYDQQRIKSFLR